MSVQRIAHYSKDGVTLEPDVLAAIEALGGTDG